MIYKDKEMETVIVIDDDKGIRGSLDSLLRSYGFLVRLYADPYIFLKDNIPTTPFCVLLDVKLGKNDGLDFQSYLVENGIYMPIIFITGYGNISMSVRSIKSGAIDFIEKPFSDTKLLSTIKEALKLWHSTNSAFRFRTATTESYKTLTEREREIMTLVVSGLMNKQIAWRLNLSIVTVKIHRSKLMKKMNAKSLADLVHMGEVLSIRNPLIGRYTNTQ